MRNVISVSLASRQPISRCSVLVFHAIWRKDAGWWEQEFYVAPHIFKRPDWETLLRQIVKASLN